MNATSPPVSLRVLSVVLAGVVLVAASWGCVVRPPDTPNEPQMVTYELAVTRSEAGSFAPLGAGQEQEVLASAEFGPEIGYPPPETTIRQDLGLLQRGDLIVIDAANGNLGGALGTIAGEPVSIDEDSSATHIGFEIPFTLDEGEHTFELRDLSGGILIAEITFRVVDPILGP